MKLNPYATYLVQLSKYMKALTDWSDREMNKLGINAERVGHKLEYHFYNSSPFPEDQEGVQKLWNALNVETSGELSATHWKEVIINPHTMFTIFH